MHEEYEPLYTYKVGNLTIDTEQQLTAFDPGMGFEEPPFAEQPNPGTYPVFSVYAQYEKTIDNVMLILLVNSRFNSVYWELATWNDAYTGTWGSNNDTRTIEGAALPAFANREDMRAVLDNFEEIVNKNILGDLVYGVKQEAAVYTLPGTTRTIVLSSAAAGSGSLPVWIGKSESGELICYLIDTSGWSLDI